ncbi:SURF1 family cytochrome oxidase biogenesis protein [Aurantiacibacter luteus]|uniref:SURF1-like protein n=1 Tax=Aurantiacibacter luteus TaxID=1581420 RepID=A0A0G9N0G4_9SPHN|nr:SURF1 family cytochrome oxidase biogenesis protein [Aurantiacibacter luteus]KLE35028.1 hypothetical protein AAW00_00560 [Aurantiacibacter luteus]
MMRRLPVIPTIVVTLAAATMVALGFWQLGRKEEKEALLATFARNAADTGVRDFSAVEPSLATYRRVRLDCRSPSGWNAVAGRSASGRSGYVHRYDCGVFAGDGQAASPVVGEIGWSPGPQQPSFAGGEIVGRLAQSGEGYKIVSEDGLAGLEPSAQPDPRDLPNNHLAYAGQWFFFALTALVIYWLALRRRWRDRGRDQGRDRG